MTTATIETVEVVHASRTVLLAEEAAGLPRRCDACGVLCRDCHFENEVRGGHGAYVTFTWCNDSAFCEARRLSW